MYLGWNVRARWCTLSFLHFGFILWSPACGRRLDDCITVTCTLILYLCLDLILALHLNYWILLNYYMSISVFTLISELDPRISIWHMSCDSTWSCYGSRWPRGSKRDTPRPGFHRRNLATTVKYACAQLKRSNQCLISSHTQT